jgi:hypothetical protein
LHPPDEQQQNGVVSLSPWEGGAASVTELAAEAGPAEQAPSPAVVHIHVIAACRRSTVPSTAPDAEVKRDAVDVGLGLGGKDEGEVERQKARVWEKTTVAAQGKLRSKTATPARQQSPGERMEEPLVRNRNTSLLTVFSPAP